MGDKFTMDDIDMEPFAEHGYDPGQADAVARVVVHQLNALLPDDFKKREPVDPLLEVVRLRLKAWGVGLADSVAASVVIAIREHEKIGLDLTDPCVCGHPQMAHIYHTEACRPGFVCPTGCQKFELATGDATVNRYGPDGKCGECGNTRCPGATGDSPHWTPKEPETCSGGFDEVRWCHAECKP